MGTKPAKTAFSRVFSIENMAGPANAPTYHTMARAGGLEQGLGDITPVYYPSPTEYGQFEVADEIVGGAEPPTLGLMARYPFDKSEFLQLVQRRCPIDIQVHFGECSDPRIFDTGWKKVLVLEHARFTSHSLGDLGALASDENAVIDEEMELAGRNVYEILPMNYVERAATLIAHQLVAVSVCDTPSCGDCGNVSSGCQRVFAVAAPAATVKPYVVFSADGFTSQDSSTITTATIGNQPYAAGCVGDYLVVTDPTAGGYHYASTADLLDNTETWALVTAGFSASNGPRAMTSVSERDTWFAGVGGYLYYSQNIKDGVIVQDAGTLTTQDLNDIYAYSTDYVFAVGNDNTFLFTTNGGSSWGILTGPEAGADLTCVFARNEREVWVGTSTGRLWYTLDAGAHWAEKSFPRSGTGAVKDIVFASNSVGFITHTADGRGHILRTINGGYSWYVAPEGSGSIPNNTTINALAVCPREVNVLYAAGVATSGTDGILIKGS